MNKISDTVNIGLKILIGLVIVLFGFGMMGMMQDMRQPVVREAQPQQATVSQVQALQDKAAARRSYDVDYGEPQPLPRAAAAKEAPSGPLQIGDMVVVEHDVYVYARSTEEARQLSYRNFSLGFLLESEPDVIIARRKWTDDVSNTDDWQEVARIPLSSVRSITRLE